ncbi:hypothetical protein LTS10_010380 [Elasticomyces elasticus]|nr:hypothetical protein LTS10_010380 [Elasticomyces elasticus]
MEPLKALLHHALFDPENAIPTIQAAVLVCLWPFPVDSTFKDPSHAVAGAAMHLAVQKGLQYASRKQDYARVALVQAEADRMFRARLWAYCVVAFQGVSLHDGLPCPQILENASLAGNGFVIKELPARLRYSYQVCQIQSDAIALILKEVDLSSVADSRTLNTLVDHFDMQLLRTTYSDQSDTALYRLLCARLFIRVFHFSSAATPQRDLGLLQAYNLACDVLQTAKRLDSADDFGRHSTHAQARMATVASLCILRVLRSPLAAQVDSQVGEEMCFEAIRLSKKRSIQNTDLCARVATILTQLWSSTKAFRLRDGTVNGLRIFLRSRLSLSILYDSLWWWRAEFGGTGTNPYIQTDRTDGTTVSHAVAEILSSTATEQLANQSRAVIPFDGGAAQDMLADLPDIADWQESGMADWDWQEMLGA